MLVFPLVAFCRVIQYYFIKGSRELKRLDSVSFSPIFNHFTESLVGITTVRAFNRVPLFEAKNKALINKSDRCWWPLQVANRWLAVRLEALGAAVAFLAALFTGIFYIMHQLVPLSASRSLWRMIGLCAILDRHCP
jgi:ABC-type multidrug transport system fused ATPase/permease subunit